MIGVVARNGIIIGTSQHVLSGLPHGLVYESTERRTYAVLSINVLCVYLAVESNLIVDVMSLNFPRIAKVEPVLRVLNLQMERPEASYLPAVLDVLLKNTIIVTNTITPSRKSHGGEGVQKAGGKTAQT